jgi:hypothetical protein
MANDAEMPNDVLSAYIGRRWMLRAIIRAGSEIAPAKIVRSIQVRR